MNLTFRLDTPIIVNQTANATVSAMPLNGLTRSRRSHFSRKDSTPEGGKMTDAKELSARIVHEYDRLLFYSNSPHSWALPKDWVKICDLWPSIVRNKVSDNSAYNNNYKTTNNYQRRGLCRFNSIA